MHFYPTTLKSQWYMADVCDSIFAALEGMKSWTASFYENKGEREAYLIAYEYCQKIVRKNDLNPKAMLQELSDYHTLIVEWDTPLPFFSWARWTYKFHKKARIQAIEIVFQLVDGVSNRFL